MKRKLEEDSINLIGRSAAERSLDRIYNRQRSELSKLKNNKDETSSILEFNKLLPFPEVSKSEDHAIVESKPKIKSEPIKRTLKEVLTDLRDKHIPNRNKFAKSVSLLSKLSDSYFKDSYKTEKDVTYLNFFSVFSAVNDVFINEFSGVVPRDCYYEKNSLISLTGVIDHILSLRSTAHDNSIKNEQSNVKSETSDSELSTQNQFELLEFKFTLEETLFLKYLKISFGYPCLLWYENDPFAFHNIVNNLKKFFEDFLHDIKTGFTLKDISKITNDPFILPNKHELMSLQLKAFVRTLGVVFSFFEFPWSKSSLVPLFSLVYLKRNVFEEADQSRISAWQSHINSIKSKRDKSISVQNIGESSFEVRDGRDEKVSSVHGSQVWSERQLRL